MHKTQGDLDGISEQAQLSLDRFPTRKRPRLSISLRLLMFAIVILAIWFAWVANHARRQRAAIDAFKKYGGFAYYDYELVDETAVGDGTKEILQKLDTPISIPFAQETPLEDVLRYIKDASRGPNDHGIPIYVDPIGLQETGKSMESPVVLDLDGVPLKTSLMLLLKQLGLTYTVKDGMMTITKQQSANSQPRYPVTLPDRHSREQNALNSLRRLLGAEYFGEVARVSFFHDVSIQTRVNTSRNDDSVLSHLENFKDLRVLILQETQATDEGMTHIRHLTKLEHLYMKDGVALTDAGVAQLQGLRNLKTLQIIHSRMTDVGLSYLGSLRRLEVLQIPANRFITDRGMQHVKGLSNLEQLDIERTQVTDEGIEHLTSSPHLKSLSTRFSKVTFEGRRNLQQAMPKLLIR